MQDSQTPKYRMPAEWEPHRATWIAWPHLDSDFPGKLEPVRWAYCELIRHLSQHETVEVICASVQLEQDLSARLERASINGDIRIHQLNYERTWLRDSVPSLVYENKKRHWVAWQFNAWAKYDDFTPDLKLPEFVAKQSGVSIIEPVRSDGITRVVLEGGAIDVDGEGTILVTEQCLLSDTQQRNPGCSRKEYEQIFSKYLGAQKTIWLGGGCEGDDTHGHIDDVARFVAPGVVVVASAAPSDKEQYQASQDNLKRLKAATDAHGRKLKVVELPFPNPIYCDGVRLPASYMNFYIANKIVMVPTFNDENDRKVLQTLADLFPDRKVVGIHCVDWVLGYGSLHCSTQQEPIAHE